MAKSRKSAKKDGNAKPEKVVMFPHLGDGVSWSKSIRTTHGRMFSANSQDSACTLHPIVVERKDGRSTIKYASQTKNDPRTLFTSDEARLQPEDDLLVIQFSLSAAPLLHTPHSCNLAQFKTWLKKQVIRQLVDSDALRQVCALYAREVFTGKWAWRNHDVACERRVTVADALTGVTIDEAGLAEALYAAIKSPDACPRSFRVTGAFRLEVEGEVHPSQLMKLGGNKDKEFMRMADGTPVIRHTKIGNALRTFDTWHPEAADLGPIAVEALGGTLKYSALLRMGEHSFHAAMNDIMNPDTTTTLTGDHALYVAAMLLRGDLVTEEKEEDKDTKAATPAAQEEAEAA